MGKAALGDPGGKAKESRSEANPGRPSAVLKLIKRPEKLDSREWQE